MCGLCEVVQEHQLSSSASHVALQRIASQIVPVESLSYSPPRLRHTLSKAKGNEFQTCESRTRRERGKIARRARVDSAQVVARVAEARAPGADGPRVARRAVERQLDRLDRLRRPRARKEPCESRRIYIIYPKCFSRVRRGTLCDVKCDSSRGRLSRRPSRALRWSTQTRGADPRTRAVAWPTRPHHLEPSGDQNHPHSQTFHGRIRKSPKATSVDAERGCPSRLRRACRTPTALWPFRPETTT